MKSKFLVVETAWVEIIGLKEAIFLKRLYDLLSWARQQGGRYIHSDGRCWIYNTYDGWHEQLPFFSVATIRRVVDELRGLGVVLTARKNAARGDHTLWYTIDEEVMVDVLKLSRSRCSKRADLDVLNLSRSSLYKNNTITTGVGADSLLPFLEEEDA